MSCVRPIKILCRERIFLNIKRYCMATTKTSAGDNLKAGRMACEGLCSGGIRSKHYAMLSLACFQHEYAEGEFRNGVVVGVVCHGTAKAEINSRYFEIHRDSIFLLNEDSRLTTLKLSKACRGYAVYYSRQFLESINVNLGDFVTARMMFRVKPCLALDAAAIGSLHDIAMPLSRMAECSSFAYVGRVEASLFSAFFYALMSVLNLCGSDVVTTPKTSRSELLFKEFMMLLAEHCERERSVEFYASKLGISSKYLSIICRTQAGKSALRVVDEAVVRRAKELLLQSDLSVGDVAEKMNFVSQSFFGKYFKQRVGISPSRYKIQE